MRLSLPLNLVEVADTLVPDLTLEGLSFPTDVAGLREGGIAVLDRLDGTVILFDSLGHESARLGRDGRGPGEYREPYAIASAGAYLAVWDKSGRLTTVRFDGSVAGTTEALRGDVPAAWQRLPTTNWDEPLQLSREDLTRRLSGLAPGLFGALFQDRDERSDTAFMRRGGASRFEYFLVIVDSLATPGDTLLTLRGQELRVGRFDDLELAMARERPYALRPVWASGEGWHAWGHGMENTLTVAFDTGDTLVFAWPRDSRPLAEPDYQRYIDWEIEGYRRTRGEHHARLAAEIPRDKWIADELMVSDERPQIVGALGDGRCLAVAGFRPDHGPHGEAGVWVVFDLDNPTQPTVVDVRHGPGFTRGLHGGRFYYIEVDESGLRRVHRMPLPPPECAPAR